MAIDTFLVVGLGSMGKRRARLLRAAAPGAAVYGVDTNPERRAQAEALGIPTFATIQQGAAAGAQAAFVCTAPLSHRGVITQALNCGLHVFTELNLVADGYDELEALAAEKGLTLFLSSTMLYRGEVQYMAKQVAAYEKTPSYIYHIGQYLPDWHPWEDYRNFFVGDARTNGCREIFAIELPWLTRVFGPVVSVHAEKDKVTDLATTYPDRFFVTLCHAGGAKGVLAVDVVCPKAVRYLEIFGEELHLFWEGNPKALFDFDHATGEKRFVNTYEKFEQDTRYSDNVVETAYSDEILNFLAVLDGREPPRYTFADDAVVLSVIDKIEER